MLEIEKNITWQPLVNRSREQQRVNFLTALAAGVWTGNNRLFEVVFVSLWYIGAISHVPVLDFMRATSTAVAMHIPLLYGMVAVALLLLACVGMQRQLQV